MDRERILSLYQTFAHDVRQNARKLSSAQSATDTIFALVIAPIDHMEHCLTEVVRLSLESRNPTGGVNPAQQALSYCLTRHAFELLANVCYVLNADTNDRTNREREWIESRNNFFRSEGFSGDHILRVGPKVKLHNDQAQRLNLSLRGEEADFVSLHSVRHYDPFEKSFYERSRYIPMQDREAFIARYKLATFISHAFYKALWPQAPLECPIVDAVTCAGILLSVTGSEVGIKVDSRRFVREATGISM